MSQKARNQYSQEFKEEAVKLITEQGYGVSEAARNLGINPNVLGRWKRKFEEAKDGKQPGTGLGEGEKAELARLRDEVRRLKMEREILKKAAAFFANESR